MSQDGRTCACIAQHFLAHSANQAHILLQGVLYAARRVCGIFAFPSLANLQALASCGHLATNVVLFHSKSDAVSETKDYVSQMLYTE